ncbi:DUF4377 domain-containing protein [Aestuariivivens insulae]|uniref:DUF4377 domain-containing protein n=1 Tax=Aestuariivivens insulae TaxID=1621988 RepID=UPI001F57EA96|nr:DUF4377 domain-containing protein [Aestuariivivens insulae]
MKVIKFFSLFIISLIASCYSDDSVVIGLLWVDSHRVDCTGEAIQTCYRIQENNIIEENDWSLFYDAIEGFDEQYEEGYIYKISVIITKLA